MSDILAVRDLEKRFGSVIAAQGISVVVPEGQTVGIIGANGAGKTTFVNMITGHLTPSKGSIHFEGRDITGLPSRAITHPKFPDARIRTPLILTMDAAEEDKYGHELFDPISIIVKTDSTADSLERAARLTRTKGALTTGLYSTDPQVIEQATDLFVEAGVALSVNLTGGVFVNQSAAFSDFHGTGANPAANAALCDLAFVANRFRVVQSRVPVLEAAQ